jgi:hypothetical protein
MTPDEMARRIIQHIESARATIDGPCGYVLHTTDHAMFVCQNDDKFWLASPLQGTVVVQRSYRSARSMMNYWNSRLSEDDCGRQVVISLRRDAMQNYIDWQEAMLEAIIEMGERRRNRISLDA